MVDQLLLSHADVQPAMNVTGTVIAVEPYGALVQLAEGVKALCPLQHMSEFQRSNPSSKFQVRVSNHSGLFKMFGFSVQY